MWKPGEAAALQMGSGEPTAWASGSSAVTPVLNRIRHKVPAAAPPFLPPPISRSRCSRPISRTKLLKRAALVLHHHPDPCVYSRRCLILAMSQGTVTARNRPWSAWVWAGPGCDVHCHGGTVLRVCSSIFLRGHVGPRVTSQLQSSVPSTLETWFDSKAVRALTGEGFHACRTWSPDLCSHPFIHSQASCEPMPTSGSQIFFVVWCKCELGYLSGWCCAA